MNKYDFGLNLETRNSISILLSKIKPNSTVLEFGPAHGRMTKYLKEELNCKVYAVEVDKQAAQDAKNFTAKMIVEDIETFGWTEELSDIQFDFIVFADVLEHLHDPQKVLLSAKEFLKSDGSILISIPNIAHNAIILNLLKNEFNYKPTGLLDSTHIKFFTKKTFEALIDKCNLHIKYKTAIYIHPQNTEFRNSYSDVPKEIGDYLKQLYFGEAYQYIFELKQQKVDLVSDFSDQHKIDHNNYIQLYIDTGDGINEKASTKLPVRTDNYTQKFQFDFQQTNSIKSLRLDPFNNSCVIEIKKIHLLFDSQGSMDIIPHISSNACGQDGKILFFQHHDPQIHFKDIDLSTEKPTNLIVEIVFKHFANEAILKSVQHITHMLTQSQKENAKLWERVKYAENILIQENSNLWKRVGKAEDMLTQSQKENAKLWERVGHAEDMLSTIQQSKFYKIFRRLIEK